MANDPGDIRCSRCGSELTTADRPTNPSDPWLCDDCLRDNQTSYTAEIHQGGSGFWYWKVMGSGEKVGPDASSNRHGVAQSRDQAVADAQEWLDRRREVAEEIALNRKRAANTRETIHLA